MRLGGGCGRNFGVSGGVGKVNRKGRRGRRGGG